MSMPILRRVGHLARAATGSVVLGLSLLGTVPAGAADVRLSGWAYGQGGTVSGSMYRGAAGGFGGSLSGAGPFDTQALITYCVELGESFSFSQQAMRGYELVDGQAYFGAERADRLGRLMGFVAADPSRVDTAGESTSLQLAIWNLVYDDDYSLRVGGFLDSSRFAAHAQWLLAGAQAFDLQPYSVSVLERAGTQDFLLWRPDGEPPPGSSVAEAPSLALAGLALLAALAASRRARRRRP